jgi:hypothetical protein
MPHRHKKPGPIRKAAETLLGGAAGIGAVTAVATVLHTGSQAAPEAQGSTSGAGVVPGAGGPVDTPLPVAPTSTTTPAPDVPSSSLGPGSQSTAGGDPRIVAMPATFTPSSAGGAHGSASSPAPGPVSPPPSQSFIGGPVSPAPRTRVVPTPAPTSDPPTTTKTPPPTSSAPAPSGGNGGSGSASGGQSSGGGSGNPVGGLLGGVLGTLGTVVGGLLGGGPKH